MIGGNQQGICNGQEKYGEVFNFIMEDNQNAN